MKNKELITIENAEELFKIVELEDRASEHLDVEPYSYWKSVIKEFLKKKSAIAELIALVAVISLSLIVPVVSSYDPFEVNVDPAFQFMKPSFEHLFGTNKAGSDVWTITWYGCRISIILALIVATINMVIGVAIGTVWGYFKKLDRIMIEVYQFISNVPALLYQMLLLFVLGPSFQTLVLALTITGWLGTALSVRNLIIIYSNREYNIASRTLGTAPARIIIYNLLPYILTVIVTSFALSIPAVISSEVGLTYLGLGLPPGVISLGSVLQSGYPYFISEPHVLFLPALVAGSVTIIFYIIGIALSDAMDPKNHR
jgi:oligopeptide transport system permease protein